MEAKAGGDFRVGAFEDKKNAFARGCFGVRLYRRNGVKIIPIKIPDGAGKKHWDSALARGSLPARASSEHWCQSAQALTHQVGPVAPALP